MELSEQLSDEQNEALSGRLVRQDPWVFDESRRAVVQAELDAIIFYKQALECGQYPKGGAYGYTYS